MNFYRRVYKPSWMTPLDRKGPDGDFDYHVLLDGEAPLIKTRGLRVLYSTRTAGGSLAEPRKTGVLPYKAHQRLAPA